MIGRLLVDHLLSEQMLTDEQLEFIDKGTFVVLQNSIGEKLIFNDVDNIAIKGLIRVYLVEKQTRLENNLNSLKDE